MAGVVKKSPLVLSVDFGFGTNEELANFNVTLLSREMERSI